MKSALVALFVVASLLLTSSVAGAQKAKLWETGTLPDKTTFEYPTKAKYDHLRWYVCSHGTASQFSDCLVKVHLLERAWEAFAEAVRRAQPDTSRTGFAEILEKLNEETARIDALYPRGSRVE